ncbi:MAG TPA: hypothetical protein VFN85_12975, partial [Solirubrobacterales bacterium]|nr:hypothetical protein [Solirubrobacterales bacterium]
MILSCGALLGVGAVPAAAKVVHQAEGSFNAQETPGGSFTYLLAISVDNSTGPSAGDVYVGGTNNGDFNGYVYKFDADGHYAGVELNGSETPQGSFGFVNLGTFAISRGLAVDSSVGANKGDVYVADAVHNVVNRFDEAGNFLCEITGREFSSLSIAEQEHECAGSAGSMTPQAGFGSTGGVAVNPVNGDVYVADTSNAVVDEFSPSGEYIGQISNSHLSTPTSLAFNSTGEIYVTTNATLFEAGNVVKFDASGSFVEVLDSNAGYVAVNPSNDSVLVFDGAAFSSETETVEYDSSGNLLSRFGQNRESGAIGVNASTGRVYLGPLFASEGVFMYGPAVVIPDVTATAATEVEQFSATLNGEVDPAGGGEVESCEFEYVTQAHFEAEGFEAAEEAPCSPATPYAGTTTVSAGLSALQPNTTYHFRLAASNSNGVASYSSGETFTTPAAVVTGQASNVTAASATLSGTVNPDGTTITDCHFEYGTTTSYGEEAPCAETPAQIGTGTSPVPVHADVTGLAENTTYHFRLVAANSDGSYPGADETLTTLSRPVIDKAFTSNLSASSVDLNAEINPMGFDTTYHFEWGASESYGNSVPVPDENIGSGTSDVLVTQHLSGLVAGTSYHWRVVATNSIGTASGKDHTFIFETATPSGAGCPNAELRTNNSSHLPDCRAYEQVSPIDKNDSDVANAFEGSIWQQASVDGERVFYESVGAFPGAPSAVKKIQYFALRDAGGWSTRAVGHPLTSIHVLAGGGVDYSLPLSPDLSAGAFRTEQALVAGAPGPEIWNLYVGHLLTGSNELVTDITPPNKSGNRFEIFFQGASTDFSHVIFSANDALTPEAPYPATNLYEWVEGQLWLVGLIPTSGTSCTGAECTPAAGSQAGGSGFNTSFFAHAISADGSRIVFSTQQHIFDRLNGTTTVDVSASQRTPSAGDAGATYQDASVDGSHVIFTSEGALTNDAVPGSGWNLYDYDVKAGQLTDLTVANDVQFQGPVGISDDASRVYFVANGVLAANPNSHGDKAVAGERNLYLWHGGQTTFIATLRPADHHDWGEPSEQAARVTPDGGVLAFNSTARLTGYDNTDTNTGEPDTETYLYDAAANRLTCASCNPSGARPSGPSDLHWTPGSFQYRPRNLSADGSRLFFTSADALLPGDTNGLYDVYEWEAEGSGSCHSSADNGGCLYLISSGHGATNSYFADASPSGKDVFFATGDRLVSSDQDDFADLYDARVGGGFPEPPPPAPCEGESCRGEGSHAPAGSGAGTSVFQGPGNPAPKHCRKGFVPRHGTC